MAENTKKGLLWEKKSYIEMQAFIKRSRSNMEKITPMSEHNFADPAESFSRSSYKKEMSMLPP